MLVLEVRLERLAQFRVTFLKFEVNFVKCYKCELVCCWNGIRLYHEVNVLI